jgi:hypothetical protein
MNKPGLKIPSKSDLSGMGDIEVIWYYGRLGYKTPSKKELFSMDWREIYKYVRSLPCESTSLQKNLRRSKSEETVGEHARRTRFNHAVSSVFFGTPK